MTESDHGRWSEDLAAYALGALEPEAAAALERHTAGCERCRAELRWLTPAVQALSESVERIEPPPELRPRLLAEVEADVRGDVEPDRAAAAGGERARRGALARLRRSRPLGLRPAVGIAALVLVVAAVGGYAIGTGIGGDSEGGATTVVTGKAPGITAKMVSEGDSGTLRLANVQPLPEDKVLQAWVQRDGEVEPVRALFVPDRSGRASTQLPDMEGIEVVMVTAEPKGGSDAPTSAPIVTVAVPG
jgi:anti-sigma-K factor RskA